MTAAIQSSPGSAQGAGRLGAIVGGDQQQPTLSPAAPDNLSSTVGASPVDDDSTVPSESAAPPDVGVLGSSHVADVTGAFPVAGTVPAHPQVSAGTASSRPAGTRGAEGTYLVRRAADLCDVREPTFRRWLYRLGIEGPGSGHRLQVTQHQLVAAAVAVELGTSRCGDMSTSVRQRRAVTAGRCVLDLDPDWVLVDGDRADGFDTAAELLAAWDGSPTAVVNVEVFRQRLAPLTESGAS